MKLTLRPYQEQAVNAVFESLKGSSNLSAYELLSMPTGTGKTPTFSEIIRLRDRKTLVLAHRDELIRQAVEKISWVCQDATIGVIQGKTHQPDADIVVASVQSMNQKRRDRLDAEGHNQFYTIITDEAHHARARTYHNIYDWVGCLPEQRNTDILHVGVTATPNRTDNLNLGNIFTNVAFERDILEFIPEYLSDLQIIQRETGIVLDGISRSANDLNCHELSDALNTKAGNGDGCKCLQRNGTGSEVYDSILCGYSTCAWACYSISETGH